MVCVLNGRYFIPNILPKRQNAPTASADEMMRQAIQIISPTFVRGLGISAGNVWTNGRGDCRLLQEPKATPDGWQAAFAG